MHRDRAKRIYALHSWAGLICGVLMFVVSFSGTVALFGTELTGWEDPAARLAPPAQALALEAPMAAFIERARGEGRLGLTGIDLARPAHPFIEAAASVRAADGARIFLHEHWHPETGEVLADRGEGLSHWLVHFHTELMLPGIWGRTLVGIVGAVMLLSIVTGFLSHRKILQELFVWRLDRSVRLRWQDTHKAIATWGLPFHLTIAFTGAFLGLVALLIPITVLTVFKGDQAAFARHIDGEGTAPAGIAAEMMSLDAALDAARDVTGGAELVRMVLTHWGDRNARIEVYYAIDRHLVRYGVVRFAAATGEVLETALVEPDRLATRIAAAMTPLHYATYGGIWLKALYAALGLSLSVMIVAGLMLWVERRAHGAAGRHEARAYVLGGRAASGACFGVVLASIALFYVDQLAPVAPDERIGLIGRSYFAVWAATIAYALVRPRQYRLTRELLALAGLGLMGIPVIDVAVHGESPFGLLARGAVAAGATGIVCFVLGLGCLGTAALLPDRRPARHRGSATASGSFR